MKKAVNSERELLTVLASDDRESTEPESNDLRKPDADGIVDLEYNEETGVWE